MYVIYYHIRLKLGFAFLVSFPSSPHQLTFGSVQFSSVAAHSLDTFLLAAFPFLLLLIFFFFFFLSAEQQRGVWKWKGKEKKADKQTLVCVYLCTYVYVPMYACKISFSG